MSKQKTNNIFKMKKTISLLLFVAIFMPFSMCFSQSRMPIEDRLGWNPEVVKWIEDHKTVFTDSSVVADIYSYMVSHQMEIHHVAIYNTPSWVDSNKKSYLRSIILYSKKPQKCKKGEPFYRLEIDLDFDGNEVDALELWDSVDQTKFIDDFMDKVSGYPVKDLRFEIRTQKH